MLQRSIANAAKGKGRAPSTTGQLRSLQSIAPSIKQAISPRQASSSSNTIRRSDISRTCTCQIGYSTASVTIQCPPRWRTFQTSARQSDKDAPQIADLDMRRYHEIADETMDRLTEGLEALQEEMGEDDFDIEYSSGVLTVKLPAGKGTYVVNKQPPNKQIWLSSPLSGPKRYDYSEEHGSWFYTRDGSFLLDLLEEELSSKLNIDVKFDALHS